MVSVALSPRAAARTKPSRDDVLLTAWPSNATMVSPDFRPALSAGPPLTTALPVALEVMRAPARVTPSASTVSVLTVTPSATCLTEPFFTISSATRLTRLDGMAKPMPMEPEELESEDEEPAVAMEELMPITSPAALKVGPPELPGLMAASICTALVTMLLLSSSITVTGRFRAETMPVVAVSS